MSEIERDGFSAREMYLMRQAMDAGKYYESLEQWLDETISDAGHCVAQHLAHDAERLYGKAARAQGAQGAEPVAWLATSKNGGWICAPTKEMALSEADSYWWTPDSIVPLYTHPPAKPESVPSRDDLIQCLLATRGQSEGVTADAILSLISATAPQPAQQGSVPEGWKLVPVKSTSEMDIAGMDSLHNSYEGYIIDRDAAETIWSAMLEAAPTPPQVQGGDSDE